MKKMTLIAISLAASQTFAATTQTSLQTKKTSSFTDKLNLTLETETMTVRDDNNKIKGSDTYYIIEPGYKVNSKLTVTAGAQYNDRVLTGDKVRGNVTTNYSKEKSKNHDALSEAFLKLRYKAAKYSENGIADVTLQARAYSNEDTFFQEYYGNAGNYQLRAYYGMPLVGNLSLNKYTTYFRYKKYTPNKDASKYSRDHELRARISPTYRLKNNVEVGTTITYNHIFKLGEGYADDEENVTADLTARYQVGKYAVLLRAGVTALDNSETGELKTTEDSLDQVGYAINFAAYL